MTEYGYDTFPSNIAETAGPIPREGFEFHFSRVVVWQGGRKVAESHRPGIAYGTLREFLGTEFFEFTHTHLLPDRFFDDPCFFSQISTNLDRLIWAVDIFRTEPGPDRQAMILGLLFRQGELSLVKVNVDAPVEVQVEFYKE